MAQTRPNEMPKIIALLAAIGVVLVFAAYQLFGGTRPPETTANVTNVPAAVQPPANRMAASAMPGGGVSGSVTPPNSIVVNARPGQMRQFDPVLDDAPDGTVPLNVAMGRGNSFELYKVKPDKAPTAPTKPNSGGTIARNNDPGPILPTFNINKGTNAERPPIVVVDNTPQQEITLDGVVTGNDGFAVLTIREPSRQNSAIPDQKRFVRMGDPIGDEKIVGITEAGLMLSKMQGTWAVGDKRGVSRRNMLMPILISGSNASARAVDSRLPPTQTP